MNLVEDVEKDGNFKMFIIPTSYVLLLATAITIGPAALQWFISFMWSVAHASRDRKVDLTTVMSEFDWA